MFRENILGGQALLQDCRRRWLLVRIRVDTNFFQESFYDFYLLPLDVCVVPISYSTSVKSEYLPPFPILSLRSTQIYCFVLLLLCVCIALELDRKILYNFLNLFFGTYSVAPPHSKYIFGAHRCKKTGINIPKQHLIFRSYFSHEKQKKV